MKISVPLDVFSALYTWPWVRFITAYVSLSQCFICWGDLVLLIRNQSLACGKKGNRLVCCWWWVGFLCIYSSQTLGAGVTECVPLRLAQFHLWSGLVNCNRSTPWKVLNVSFLLLALLSVTRGISCDLSLLIFLLLISLVAGLCLWLSRIFLAYLMWVLCAHSTHMKVPSIVPCLFMLAYIW